MTEEIRQPFPKTYIEIEKATKAAGFTMASDILTCSLLRTLAASKPSAKFLEFGTGTGLSASWILDGMDGESSFISIDNEPFFLEIAKSFLGDDMRLDLLLTDAGKWIEDNRQQKFDYIFADSWHGKYLLLEESLSMLNKGGFYIIDDMLPQPNWPDGHQEKAIKLINYLENRKDLLLTKQIWATGIMIAVKK
jgi:predicted O-methyltransferase YrrM